jgi:hypothetical protein
MFSVCLVLAKSDKLAATGEKGFYFVADNNPNRAVRRGNDEPMP